MGNWKALLAVCFAAAVVILGSTAWGYGVYQDDTTGRYAGERGDEYWSGTWGGSYQILWQDTYHEIRPSGSAEFSFTGTGVGLLMLGVGYGGPKDVFVDDEWTTTVNGLGQHGGISSNQPYYFVPVTSGLEYGSHTLEIASGGGFLVLDAIVVEVGNIINDRDPRVTYVRPWPPRPGYYPCYPNLCTPLQWYGEDGTMLDSTASAELTFTGTAVDLITQKRPSEDGIANIYVDGSLVLSYNTLGPWELQKVVPVASGLSYGTHKVKVVPSGPVGHDIVSIDGFAVRTDPADVYKDGYADGYAVGLNFTHGELLDILPPGIRKNLEDRRGFAK